MADPVVHITNGVPDSGTGNITTLGQTLLDGAHVTIGAKADAKSTATDSTAVTVMQVLKQVSASAQLSATVAKQPALGTAGAASTDVITIQGIASGTVVPVSDGAGSLTVDNGGTFAVQATLAAETTKVLGVTRSADGAGNLLTSATRGAERALSVQLVDGSGAQVTSFSGPTQYTEDAAAAADPVGSMLVAVRRDTLSTSEVSADGDNIALKASNKGKLHVAAELRFGDTVSDVGTGTGGSATQRVIVDSGQLATLQTTQPAMSAGFQAVGLPSDLPWPKGLSNRAFGVAFATLTRPANTTAYTAADSISDNATAGSVTALISGNISDTNDDPIFINEIHINSTDTGLAGKKIRAYLYNSDPTASSGVVGGDNATFSNKKAGYLGSFMGWMETGFSDGTVGRLVPCFNETNFTQAGGFIVVPPKSGARTLYIQYQAVEAFTPSANSTTIIGTARGWQGRAA